ncbi:hypothetical protein CFIO01_00208 [Colletotrichum fioriniae PJ7]|uniref:Uncharacterized protein n=1 Tax=Colletotrichum fioriniae PJ7 TaxID=1445577 RepID=A0A010S0Z5_9PEZI|nr:hypothetical protein CFIO01_00208 [Colletotrichum fioriniae PJ7]
MASTHTDEPWQSVIEKMPIDRVFKFCKDATSIPLNTFVIDDRPSGWRVKATVSMKTMRGASERFAKWSSDPRTREKLEYDLSKSYSGPILILFDIAHGTKTIFPEKVSAPELSSLVINAHMYQLEDLLNPYLERWMPAQSERLRSFDYYEFIAWVALKIDSPKIFDEMITRLALDRHADREGNLVKSGSIDIPLKGTCKFIDDAMIPDKAAELRKKFLSYYLNNLRIAMTPNDKNRSCVAENATPDERERCSSAISEHMAYSPNMALCETLRVDGDVVLSTGYDPEYSGSVYDLGKMLSSTVLEALMGDKGMTMKTSSLSFSGERKRRDIEVGASDSST